MIWNYCITDSLQGLWNILYCAWSFVSKKYRKQDGMLAFFCLYFLCSEAFTVAENYQNLLKKQWKTNKNGGLGWFWGLLGRILEAFGPQDGPKLKKSSKMTPLWHPPGAQMGANIWKKVIWRHVFALKNMSRSDAWKNFENKRFLDPPRPQKPLCFMCFSMFLHNPPGRQKVTKMIPK